MAFVCMCCAATLDIDAPPDTGTEEVRKALNELDFEDHGKLVICLDGGGIAASGLGKTPELAVVGSFIAVLGGALSNYAYLVRKYCLEELGLPSTVSLEAVRERTPIREAALLCKLYDRLGTGMLTKLRGKFAFCIFDSITRKVLAARDASGAVSLVHGKTDDGYLFVASGEYRPAGAVEVSEIGPGRFVYGFGEERKFCNPEEEVIRFAAEATSAASAALKGIKLDNERSRSLDSVGPMARRSSDAHRRRSTTDYFNAGHRRAYPGGEYGQWQLSGADGKVHGRRRNSHGGGRRPTIRSSIEKETPWHGDESKDIDENNKSDAGGSSATQSSHRETKDAAAKTDGPAMKEEKSAVDADKKANAAKEVDSPDAPAKSVGDTSLVSVH